MPTRKEGQAQSENEQLPMAVNDSQVKVSNDLTVQVIPSNEHEFLMTSKDVALGYGVTIENVRGHKFTQKEELKEGIHFINGIAKNEESKGVRNSNTLQNVQPHQIFWTKAGVIRLGFFIKSERAIMFRDWAEKVVLMALSTPPVAKELPMVTKRKHNRLTQERIISILSDIALIENKELRERLVHKITGGSHDNN